MTHPFVMNALLGMGIATVLLGFMYPALAYALLTSLLISGSIIVMGYHVARRFFGD